MLLCVGYTLLCVVCLCSSVFLFFKQKTAYEMRISDWSSDACSSDLFRFDRSLLLAAIMKLTRCSSTTFACRSKTSLVKKEKAGTRPSTCLNSNEAAARHPFDRAWRLSDSRMSCGTKRSEEHTSELQSLMRISYAVFCLKKKKYERNNTK